MKDLIHSIIFILIGISVVLIARELKNIKTLIIKHPKTETIIKTVEVEKNVSPIPYKSLGVYTLTFYTHTGNRTKTGVYPKAKRTIAVDPKVIPLGSVVYVEGWGVYVAEDTGGKVKGQRLDMFVDSNQEAINNGIKKARVYKIGKS